MPSTSHPAPNLFVLPYRLANRLRSLLPEDQRTLLEAALASLAPVLDLRSRHPADSSAKGQGPEVAPALAAGHAVIEELAQQGCERAEAVAQAAADGAAQLVAAPAAAAGEAAAADGEQEASAGGSSEEQQSAAPAAPAEQPPAPAALKALSGLHADGVKSVAELCSLCLERLLALGRSISYFYRSGRPANDGAPAALRCRCVDRQHGSWLQCARPLAVPPCFAFALLSPLQPCLAPAHVQASRGQLPQRPLACCCGARHCAC